MRGTVRVHFGRVVREFPYRACTVQTMPDAPYTESDPLATMARADLLAERDRLAPLGLEVWRAPPVLEANAGLSTVVGTLATAVRIPADDKLALLAEDNVVERARLLRARLRLLGPAGPPPPPALGRN